MPNPLNRPLKKIRSCPKPVTPLQEAYLGQREKNQRQIGRSAARADPSELTVSNSTPTDEDLLHNRSEEFENNDFNFDFHPRFEHEDLPETDGYDEEQDEEIEGYSELDEDEEILSGLARADYDAKRLKQEIRWAHQCKCMTPIFLRCRQATSNWASKANWDSDWKTPCTCPSYRRRVCWVDMVDLHTRQKAQVLFCDCQSDPVRLVEMGYIGATPVHPKTAFSIRLLKHFQVVWKYCAQRIQGFMKALDELLDDDNPMILTESGYPRDWREPFTSALDAYRSILREIREQEFSVLQFNAIDHLSANCPRCFGPPVGITKPEEPDYIVCLDGNFQHRRHAAASVPIPGYHPALPELFMSSDHIVVTDNDHVRAELEKEVHPCTEQHTAANDVRGKSHWGGCDETGLFGMGCRHDHTLRLINIVQSGEKSSFGLAMIHWILEIVGSAEGRGQRRNQVGFLYDIGCSVEKGIVKRKQFSTERQAGRLKFGTSVFHAYVHEWGCQLDYNPRLNLGWGFSDGEGMERKWSDLTALVRPNRYATKQHRLVSLSLRSLHCNEVLKTNSVRAIRKRGKEVKRRLEEAKADLLKLLKHDSTHTLVYLETQWGRQKEIQKKVISETAKDKRTQLTVLLELEEELVEARDKLRDLKAKAPRMRTGEEQTELRRLPNTVVLLETKAQALLNELGSEAFRDSSDGDQKALLTIQIAKAKLYEAKVGVVENQRRSEMSTGTTQQTWINKQRNRKNALLKKKFSTYHRHVSKYNSSHRRRDALADLTFEDIESMPVTHGFWDLGGLSHPEEQWASNDDTKEGIRIYLVWRAANEELLHIARETRQLIRWALEFQVKLDDIRREYLSTDDHAKADRMKFLYITLVKKTSRLWMMWDVELKDVLDWSAPYFDGALDMDPQMYDHWRMMKARSMNHWAELVDMPHLFANETNGVLLTTNAN